MPLVDGTVTFSGLSKSSDMSGFLEKPVLQYGGPYFSNDPRGKDEAEFTPSCINSNSLLLDATSPISQLSGTQGQSLIIRRQDSSSSDDGHSSSKNHTQFTLGFTAYSNKSIGNSSPTAAASATVRKTKTRGENASPLSDSPVYLAIPKAVYGHNPCCHDLGCMVGHRYSLEHRSQQMPAHADFKHAWTQAQVHHSKRSPIQQRAEDTPRGLQLDPGDEQIQIAANSSRGRILPARIEPNYSAYTCMPPHSMFASLSEQSRHLQPSPRGYAGILPSHATYEHMTSELYKECSPMTKYGHLTKQPLCYSSQANVEVENRTHHEDTDVMQREDTTPIRKHTTPNQRDHYTFPVMLHGDIPLFLHSTETLPHHSFVQGFHYPCYALSGFHLSPNSNLKTQNAPPGLHSNSVPSSAHCLDHPMSSAASNSSQHVGPSHTHHSFLRMDQISPTRFPLVSPSHIQMRRFFPSFASRHLDQPAHLPCGLAIDRVLDYSSCEGPVTCPKQHSDLPVSPVMWHPPYPSQRPDCDRAALANSSNLCTVIAPGNKHSDPSTSVLKGILKRSNPDTLPLLKIKEEALDLYETDLFKKRQKLEMEDVPNKSDSPEMPVIDSVFSLAPYQTYMLASGVLPPDEELQRTTLSPKNCEIKRTTCIKEIKSHPEVPPTHVCPGTPVVDVFEATNIKVEKTNPPDTCDSSVGSLSQALKDHIKTEPEDPAFSEISSLLVIKKCEPVELETKPSSVQETDPKPPSSLSLSYERTPHEEQVVSSTEPQPQSAPQLPEAEFDNRTIPPDCLKISSHKISLHDLKFPGSAPPQETVEVRAELAPKKQNVQVPVRKHFLVLHRSLCKVVSKCVSATSEQKLRTWLAQQELPELSTKIQKISSLLGIKARHKWFNEEINSALQEVLDRLKEYIMQGRCPFPHVMRTGAVFLPMLVVKELLFPVVPGTFIDQVLQEHRVELRPTTLSEEKILIQLHKRNCSSRLRKLMSLKHLPSVYTDVLNLFYYSNVCKHLGVGPGERLEVCEAPNSSSSKPTSPTVTPRRPKGDKDKRRKSTAKKTKSRVKSSSRRMFLDNSCSNDEDDTSSKSKELNKKNHNGERSPTSSENVWTRPLTSDNELEDASVKATFQPASHKGSGVVLKLRRMLSHGPKRKKARYQAVSQEEENTELPLKLQRTGSLDTLRLLSCPKKGKKTSLLKIKYCPYLSACHSTEHRRQWVLRSAVRHAQGAMKFSYPELVGKRIRHLYEEDDGAEVWYRGEVVCVHEAHSNPLKTVFEVRYDSEPGWKYYLELQMDYRKGWIKIEEDT
ncbi:uncharacterized protein C15orf39 homolog [Dunckerocampus dactyliophorus]|uniref:uncharacterized protein C15orf39 homolog n=1 Tax=Dunckerocampus dactyliophorus TaxID=161453 RepID=UPI002404EBB1|nr:uncharacterized protein C15orf39 homolog [Dunckerocampus dactyliophorus]XP_054633704.1 uncharacterized protein C15orf39 homolog [Dunckerocampus dactyliophorus]